MTAETIIQSLASGLLMGLLYGLRMDGVWMHVGTPDAIAAAEDAFLASVA